MSIQGIQSTADYTVDGQRPLNWREGVLFLFPNGSAPLFGLTAGLRKRSVDDPEFNWFTQKFPSRRVELAANIPDAVATNFTAVERAQRFKAGDILRVEQTDEHVLIVADPVTDTDLVVQRGFANTAALAAGVDIGVAGTNPNLMYIGNAQEEGSRAPTGVALKPDKFRNYTQIFRDTLEMTRTAQATRLRTGDQVEKSRQEALEKQSQGIEFALFFGRQSETIFNGKPRRTTGGLIEYIPTENVFDVGAGGGAWTMEDLEEFMRRVFTFGSNEKMVFLGNEAMLAIQRILRKNAQWEFQSGIREYGMRVSRVFTSEGTLVFRTHPLFNLHPSGTQAGGAFFGLSSWMFCLDMGNIQWVNLNGGDTEFESDLEENDLDGMKAGFITEGGLQLDFPDTHFLVKGLRTGAVD